MVLEAIKYDPGLLKVLNQLRLPHQLEYEPVRTVEDAWAAIKDMRVRGAPAIAIVAALGLAVELAGMPAQYRDSLDAAATQKIIHEKLDYLVTSRPTAVNLGGAAKVLKGVVDHAAKGSEATGATVQQAYIKASEQMLKDDVRDNENIGKHGAAWLAAKSAKAKQGPMSIVTHCNTGSLATAGYGTALGVIRSVFAAGQLRHAFCTETRPYNQGSRLTAFELVHDKIPATLITDSMISALLRLKGIEENIAAIIVGADRVAANGDTANKIGTYNLAVTARHHGIKFLVAAPRTTIDLNTASGDDIKIEERAGQEMTTISGPVVRSGKLDLESPAERVSIAADGVGVWNPAFDVTPASLIDGIITEVGVAEPDGSGVYHLDQIMAKA